MGEPWWTRTQIEIGGRWQLLPDKNTTWSKWVFDPFANVVWPGKRVEYGKTPDGCWSEPWTIVGSYDSPTMSAVATYYWASAGVRVLGLDIGAAIIFRPAPTTTEQLP